MTFELGRFPVVDTMIGFPHRDVAASYATIRSQTRDAESQQMAMPAGYMFKDVPEEAAGDLDPVAYTLAEMDRWGVTVAMVSAGKSEPGKALEPADRAVAEHPDRFVGSYSPDPNEGVEAVRKLRRAHADVRVRAVTLFPAGFVPQVPIDHRRMYPLYSACVELGIPVFVNVGIPGPRVLSDCQHVALLEPVLYDFPELTVVMRHGAEPWVEHAVKLMVKWPNLYYSTSAFAPRYYPQAIVDYANTRGADRVIYGGYFPMGLSLERIMTEMAGVGFKDEVWPKFLGQNAARVLGITLP